MITPLLLAALQAVSGPQVVAHSPLTPRELIAVRSVGQVVLAESPSPGLSAIRIFVPVSEQFGEAGAGRVLTELATERVRGVAARTGAKFAAVRSGSGIAYTVSGSDLNFDYLFLVAARAVAAPSDEGIALRRAIQQVRTQLEPAAETGRGWVIADLTDRMCPTVPPWLGSSQELSRFDGQRLQGFWSRTHARGGLVVTVATALPSATVLAGLDLVGSRLPAAISPGVERQSGTAHAERARAPSVLRRWYGEARPVPSGFEAEAVVVGELISSGMAPDVEDFELFAELRETACGTAMVTVGSSYRGGSRAMRRRVTSFVEDLTSGLHAEAVAEASATVQLRLLSEADTPEGRARAVGSLFEGRAETPALVDALGELRLDDVTGFLNVLRARDPLRAELNP